VSIYSGDPGETMNQNISVGNVVFDEIIEMGKVHGHIFSFGVKETINMMADMWFILELVHVDGSSDD